MLLNSFFEFLVRDHDLSMARSRSVHGPITIHGIFLVLVSGGRFGCCFCRFMSNFGDEKRWKTMNLVVIVFHRYSSFSTVLHRYPPFCTVIHRFSPFRFTVFRRWNSPFCIHRFRHFDSPFFSFTVFHSPFSSF